MNMLAILAPVLGIVALLFAASLSAKVSKQDAGTDRMKEIAAFIHEGAQAFLMAEYKILVVFVAVLFVGVGVGIGWVTAVAFLGGAVFSTIAGYCGMNVATKANVRTAAAAKDSGMNKALSIAFSGGAVMGMCVVEMFSNIYARKYYCDRGVNKFYFLKSETFPVNTKNICISKLRTKVIKGKVIYVNGGSYTISQSEGMEMQKVISRLSFMKNEETMLICF
jgi:Na+/H+-translocating membrane pyrophosphatase